MAKKRIIIVGAGPGGLTAGMLLANRGFDVTIVEKQSVVGGRNAPLTMGGYTFDTGPTFLMMNFVLEEMFKEVGRKASDLLKFERLDPMYRLAFEDKEVVCHMDEQKMAAEIARQFPGEEVGFSKFMRREGKRYEMLFPCLQKDYSSLGSMFSKPLLKALPYLSLGRSLFDNLGSYFSSERLKLSFTFQSKYIGMAPWDCPALFTMIPYVEHKHGIYHVIGGLNKISQVMAEVFADEGGVLRLGSEVKRLVLAGKKVTGVQLDSGEIIHADDVIINADFAHAMTNLVEPGVLRKYSKENLAKREYSCSTFMLYLGVNKQYPMAHHTIVFSKDYRTFIDKIFSSKTTTDDISCYIQNACVTDPTLAPDGKSTVYVLVPVPNLQGNTDWAGEKQRMRDLVISVIEKRTAMKDLSAHIEVEKIITPSDWESQYDVYTGGVFNLSHRLTQMLYLRPRNCFEELDNCYLVGGGTHPGSGLPTIYESARISSNLICRKHGISFTKPTGLSEKTPVET